jgi:hypothetical protein
MICFFVVYRWGLYYGIKALAKDDPEAMIFWSLLNEVYGDDGLQFVTHCLSVILSLAGSELWAQLGLQVLQRGSNVNVMLPVPLTENEEKRVRVDVWVDIHAAREAATVILERALSSQLSEALEAINALKVVPDVEIFQEEDFTETANAAEDDGDAGSPSKESKSDTIDSGIPGQPKEATHVSLFMWLRLMLRHMQAEQVHRTAAVRLMFETAAIGALIPEIDEEQIPEKGGQNQVRFPQFQAICKTLFPSLPMVEVATLYTLCYEEGHRRVNADIFCKVADRQKLFSRELKLTALPLMAVHSPGLLKDERVQKLIAQNREGKEPRKSNVSTSPERTSVVSFNDPKGGKSSPRKKKKDAEPKRLPSSAKLFLSEPTQNMLSDMEKQQILRVHLGSTVHRKFAAMLPDLISFAENLPDKFRGLVMDHIDAVKAALSDSFKKQQKRYQDSYADQKGFRSIDGLQPFVHYRRLLSVVLLIRGLLDNPVIPSEVFGVAHRNVFPNLTVGTKQAEIVLSALEQSFFVGNGAGAMPGIGGGGTDANTLKRSKYFRFERARASMVARKLQLIMRKHITENKFPVPRSVRACMRPGYLLGQKVNPPIRQRAIAHDPWWVEEIISGVYALKLAFDIKASACGFPPIALSTALCTFQYMRWGSIEVAERCTHDFFHCMHLHYYGAPRIRQFGAFLGADVTAGNAPKDPSTMMSSAAALAAQLAPSVDEETEPVVWEMLRTPMALSLYLSLLLDIHRERAKEDEKISELQKLADEKAAAEAASAAAASAGGGAGTADGAANPEGEAAAPGETQAASSPTLPSVDSNADPKKSGRSPRKLDSSQSPRKVDSADKQSRNSVSDTTQRKSSPKPDAAAAAAAEAVPVEDEIKLVPLWRIDALFPSSPGLCGLEVTDGKDIWLENLHVLKNAFRHWTHGVKGLDKDAESLGTFDDLIMSLRRTADDEVDVDDFLWIIMMQYAKYAVWYRRKAALRASMQKKPVGVAINAAAEASGKPATAPPASENTAEKNVSSEEAEEEKVVQKKTFTFSTIKLNQIMESVYRPGEGAALTDPVRQGQMYVMYLARQLQCRDPRKPAEPYLPEFGMDKDALEHLLVETNYWETNTGPNMVFTPNLREASPATLAMGMPDTGRGSAASPTRASFGAFSAAQGKRPAEGMCVNVC